MRLRGISVKAALGCNQLRNLDIDVANKNGVGSWTLRRLINLSLFIALLAPVYAMSESPLSFRERLQPVPRNSGFKMEGYQVWGGSLIKVDSTYHLFASRWVKGSDFPEGYRQHSEIVRAVSQDLLGPYEFQEVVIGERERSYWDSNMAHNPTIHKIGSSYVLFYIGSDFATLDPNKKQLYRSIGYANADSIEGPWRRSPKPVINEESNNPAVLVEEDGSVKLMFRDAPLRVIMATAPSYEGPYIIQNENVWPECKLEDFYLFKYRNEYHCICEDNVGKVSGHVRWGVRLCSKNGVRDWEKYEPAVVYDHDIKLDDGTVLHCIRRERPQLYIEGGAITCLLTGVYDGENSWCQPVRVSPPYALKNSGY
ncbi:MAG: glycoside hydrolase family protein [Deltaproteobacteria bacterium]|nr:glycoside hydrolase family protein [Deltaproteobacteria bacterium]